MGQIRTHYDNLKIARNAPPEIIRAAYKTLSQKFHPDRNPGNTEAARIMVIINSAYEVLSDPDKRREHDLWIEQQEKEATQAKQPYSTPPQSPISQQPLLRASSDAIYAHVRRNWFFYGDLAL